MKKHILTSLLLSIPLVAANAAEKISILLVDGQNNHKWQSTTPVMKAGLEKTGRFTVDVSTSPAKKAEEGWDKWNPDFSKYDAVLSNYNGQSWPDAVQKNLEKYVSNGGGSSLSMLPTTVSPTGKNTTR